MQPSTLRPAASDLRPLLVRQACRAIVRAYDSEQSAAGKARLLGTLALLHPVSLSDLPATEVERARRTLAVGVAVLRRGLAGRCGEKGEEEQQEEQQEDGKGEERGGASDAAVVGPEDDASLRLALAVRCNAFRSGIFLHQAIFNHSCRES